MTTQEIDSQLAIAETDASAASLQEDTQNTPAGNVESAPTNETVANPDDKGLESGDHAKSVDEIKRLRKRAQRAERAERERAEEAAFYKGLVEGSGSKSAKADEKSASATEETQPVIPKRPRPSGFEDEDAYLDAMDVYEAEKAQYDKAERAREIAEAIRKVQPAPDAEAQTKPQDEGLVERSKREKEIVADFQDKLMEAAEVDPTIHALSKEVGELLGPAVATAGWSIMESELAVPLLRYFHENPAEAKKIAALPAHKGIRAVDAIEKKLIEQKPKPKMTSSAPPPPAKTVDTQTTTPVDDDDEEAFVRSRNEKEQAERQRGGKK